MKKISLLIYAICALLSCANAQSNSSDGQGVNPVGTYRTLNVFINIIYNQNPTADPMDKNAPFWPTANVVEGVTTVGPTYFDDFIDASYTTPQNVNGTLTRIFHESSFGKLILLGDMVVVNIKQSTIKPFGGGFSSHELFTCCLALINAQSLNSKYGHNSITDYDSDSNDKVDFVQYFCRNGTSVYGLTIPAGGLTSENDCGFIKLNGISREIERYSFQNATDNISQNYKHLSIHEFAHNLFGSNAFHTSGGNHYMLPGNACTFMGLQGGWGLMGAANSSLVSCNAFERWRLNWTSSTFNPNGIRIQASNVNSDIDNTSGHKTFYLRDFVSTGDAIRIKLQYKDNSTSSNQYIWLENHQIGKNNKLDFFQYANQACIPSGTPGVYAYYQVGKDVLSGSASDVWPENETDNLKVISAEGNWDMIFEGSQSDCIGWGNRTIVKSVSENPLSGYNDQMKIFHNVSTSTMRGGVNDFYGLVKKYSDNSINAALPALGDNADAFTGNTKIGISTNPPSANTVTYHVNQNGGTIEPSFSELNTRKVYLNGLQISFSIYGTDQFGDIYKVDIDWDKYDIENNVRWTGNIVLKETAILKANKTILFNQNKTPNQKDLLRSISEFCDPTFFTCENNSLLKMEDNSHITLDENSTFTLKSGSTLEINDGAAFDVKNGSKLVIEDGASVIVKGSGGINIMCGGVICVSPNAYINLQDNESHLSILDNGYSLAECSADIASLITGNGSFLTSQESDSRFVIFPQNLSLTCVDLVPPVAQIGSEVVARNGIDIIYNGEIRIDGDCSNSFALKRTWTLTRQNAGLCGTQISRTQFIDINDNIEPQFINFPIDKQIGISQYVSNYNGSEVTGIDNCSDQLSVQYLGETIHNGLCDYQNAVERKWRISDGCNTLDKTQYLLLYDDIPPVFTLFPEDMEADCDYVPARANIATEFAATDNCGPVTIEFVDETLYNWFSWSEYDIVRTWQAVDGQGNATLRSQTIWVRDYNEPMIDIDPLYLFVSYDDGFPPYPNVSVTDNCDNNPTWYLEYESSEEGNCVGESILVRSYGAYDDRGNWTDRQQYIYISDITPPWFTAFPQHVTVNANAIPPVATYGNEILAEDNTPSVVNCIYNGERIILMNNSPTYTLVRSWTIMDNCENSYTQEQNITVMESIQTCSMPFNVAQLTSGTISKSYNASEVSITNATFSGSSINAEVFSTQGITLGANSTVENGASLQLSNAACRY